MARKDYYLERKLLEKYGNLKKEEKAIIKSRLRSKIKAIKNAEYFINPPFKIKLPKVDFGKIRKSQLNNWLWSGLPPINVQSDVIDGRKVYIFWVPGEKKTIHQVILAFDDKPKFFCSCQRNERALSWIPSYGWCSHKVRAYYYITGKYRRLLSKLDEVKRKQKIERWENQLEKYKNGDFIVDTINDLNVAAEVSKESIKKEEWDKLVKTINKFWDKVYRIRLKLRNLLENNNEYQGN